MINPSVVLYGAGKAEIEERPVPALQHPNDVIVRINYVGVCGSDVHFWTQGGMGDKIVTQDRPIVMGHEACGTVEQVGADVKILKPGDRVAIEPGCPCRTCIRCKEGFYNLCPDMEFAASPPDTPGVLSKFWRASADFCYQLPAETSLLEGIFAEPLAVAAHAVRMVDIRLGDKVIVFGAGTIGLLSMAVARYYGASKIVAVDMLDHRLRVAREISGADAYESDASGSPAQNAATLVKQYGFADKVIEATGASSCINTAIYALRPGGHMVQTGVGRPLIEFPIVELSMKEIHLHGAFRYGPGDFAVAMEILKKKVVPLDRLLSKIFPFEETTEAWDATKRGEGIKNVIQGVE